MNILIVYCHPSQESYTYRVLQQLTRSLNKASISYEVSDLYASDFQSDMSVLEYQREGLGQIDLSLPEDVILEHQKIEKADGIIFLYPVWWSDCPAKLKGWFDRVYSLGYAYGLSSKVQAMKTKSYGLVLCTAGHPNEFLHEMGMAQSMRTVMIDDRLGKRFQRKEMIILGGTLDMESVREIHEEIVAGIGEKILSEVEDNN